VDVPVLSALDVPDAALHPEVATQARRPFPASPQILVSPQILDALPSPAAVLARLDLPVLPVRIASDASDAVPQVLQDRQVRRPFLAAVLVLQDFQVPLRVCDRKSAGPAEFHPVRLVHPLLWVPPVVVAVAVAAHCIPAADPSAA
jgi:hypothetical protein